MTVLGPLEPSRLGVVCPHEHVLIDMSCYLQSPEDEDPRPLESVEVELENRCLLENRPESVGSNFVLDDLNLAVAELVRFREAGGGTIVDVTLGDIGRDPEALVAASARSGIAIVMGCGYYVWQSHAPEVSEESAEQLADRIIRDLVLGVGETGVRAGVIGEIGTSPEIHPDEAKVLRSAAFAHLETGAAITLHACSNTRHALKALDILEDAGPIDMSRVIVGHQDAVLDLDYHLAVLDRGAVVQFDLFGHHYYDAFFGNYWMPSDGERVEMIAAILKRGFRDQLLVSQDVCMKMCLTAYGGGGYSYLSDWIELRMHDAGIDEEDIHYVRVENPARLLDTFIEVARESAHANDNSSEHPSV